jgi:UDP-N-acetylmuramoyl-L-alanyl-D-glutamate--2,6-diaminopimelate ligase
VAVLNKDDDSFRYLSPIPADWQVVYGMGSEERAEQPELERQRTSVVSRRIEFGPDATRFTIELPGEEVLIETALLGAYNVSNVLAAASAGVALRISSMAIAEGVAALKGIPGRMERIDEGQKFVAIVDFAHTPNALQNALETARTMVTEGGRLVVVFGCAGLRDREKRPMMGRIAGKLADVVVITAEDPRTENLEDIIAESAASAIEEGKREGFDLFCVPDRGAAILKACQVVRTGDAEGGRSVVIVCGKGHEQSMCFGTTEYPWDDREAVRRALGGESLDSLPTAGVDAE